MKRQDGMSLIAILITIPVVLILGAITVGLALGEHGLLNAKTYEEYNKKVDNATMQKMLKKGATPYHTCYTVEDIQQACEQLKDMGFTPLFAPVEAPAQTEAPSAE